MKKKKKKKTPFYYQDYPLPYVAQNKNGSGAVVGTKGGGALPAGKPR